MKYDDEKQRPTHMRLDHSVSLDGDLETLRSRLRWAHTSQELAVGILAILNREVPGLDAIREILRMVKEFTGLEAVGIRLREGEDFPYFETKGFPGHFVKAENYLCGRAPDGEIIRDSAGNPALECMCGNIIQGRTNPSFPFFTQGGSFWSNSTTELLASTSEEDRQARTRNRCNGEGYESVALIPLRSGRDIIGLLQLNDSRKNCFTEDMIGFLEGIAASIGIVLERKTVEEALADAKNELEQRVEERTAALNEVNEKLILEISEHKRAEEQIKRAQEFLNTIVDSVPVPVFAKSAKDGQFILWNKASETLFGFIKEQVIGKTDYDFFPKEQADFFWEKDRETFASGAIVNISEEPILTKSLGTRILHTSKVPVYDKAGQPSYLLAISQDITERKQAAQALQASEERYRTLVENVGLRISLIDSDHNVIVSNTNVGKWFGRPASELSGKKCFHEFENSEAICKHCPGVRAMATGQPAEAETEGVRPDGTYVVVNLRAFPMFGPDGVATGFTEIIEDITERREAEKALRESEQRFRAVFENNHLVMFIIDPETNRIEDASPGACAFYGYDREELRHKNLSEINILSPEQLFQCSQMAKSRQSKYFDFQHRLASGEIRDVEVCSGPIASDGRTLLFSVITDVTDRKRAEQALKESEEQYRAVFDNAGIGINVVDREMRLAQANPALLKMLGYTEQEARQLALPDIIHPDDRASACQDFDALMRELSGPYRVERRYVKKDGSTIWADLSVSPIREAGGTPRATVGVIADITERKRTEEALFQAKHDWEETFNSITDVITVHDKDFNIIGHNQAAEKMLGLPNVLIPKGMKCHKYYHGRNSPPEACPSCGCLATGEEAIFELFEPHLNKFIEIRAIPRFDSSNRLTGVIHIVRDITERKRTEDEKAALELQLRQSQKMEAIGTLAGGIAHDFNNLLTVILGYSELIISEKDERDRDYEDLKKVIHAGQTAADMVQQILAFSRKTETKFWPVNLNNQVPKLRKLLSRLIPRTIEVQIDLASDLPTVNADPAQIDQILMNLAVNARDAMPNGGKLAIETETVVLDDEYCSTHIEASKGLHALLTVSDTGTGIDRASSDHIFEPFYTTKKPGQGTGLGLAVVYGIVKGHRGHITMRSVPGVGTTFKIYLPAHQVQAEPNVATSADFSASGTGTILLVDDEEFVRSLGGRILEASGYQVLTARDGQEAVEIYRQKRDEISLVILDLIMPVLDGKQCLDQILKVNPQAKVLIASEYSPDGATRDVLASGAKGFVNKPYDIRQMVESVRGALDSC